jgi:hypothetical protein
LTAPVVDFVTPTPSNGTAARPAEPPTLWATELSKPLPPLVMVSTGLTISPGRPTVFAGEGGCRKGWLAMAVQVYGAAGLKMLGFDFKHELRSVYLDYEQTRRPSQERYQLLANGCQIDLASLGKRLGYRWRPIPTLAPKGDLERERVIDELCWQVDGMDVAFVDSIRASSLGTDENSVAASVPLDVATAASEKTGAAFVFLDHAGKPRDNPPGPGGRTRKHTQRGHSSKLDASQTLFIFSAAKGEPTLVTCERSQLVAESAWPTDFRFTVAPHNGGLRLEKVVSPVARLLSQDDQLAKLCNRFLAALRPNPGATTDEIMKRLGARAKDVRRARDTLERKGRIENRGTTSAPKWWPVLAVETGNE